MENVNSLNFALFKNEMQKLASNPISQNDSESIFISDLELVDVNSIFSIENQDIDVESIFNAENTSYSETLSNTNFDPLKSFNVIDYDVNNVHNVAHKTDEKKGEDIIDENGNKIGKSNIKTIYNKNGEVIKEITEKYDLEGNLIGKQVVEYTYDEWGKLREQLSQDFDKDEKETLRLTEKFDSQGRTIEESSRLSNPDGSYNQKRTLYSYVGNSDVYKNKEEKIESRDKNGNVLYEMENEVSLLEALKEKYPDCKKLKKCKNIDDALKICKEEGIDVSKAATDSLLNESFDNTDYEVISLGEESFNLIAEEIRAKLDLMVINNKKLFGSSKVKSYEKDLEKAIQNKDEEALQKLYNKINKELYPEGSHDGFGKELLQVQSANDFYNSIPSEEVQTAFDVREDFDPKTMTPESYGEMMLSEMQELKEQYEMYKDQMGAFDQVISLCNVLGFGTSEYEVEKMFEAYEKQLRELSTLEGEEFISKFKALTGDDFSEEKLLSLAGTAIVWGHVDTLENQELIEEAKKLGIDINDAYVTDYENVRYVEGPNQTLIPQYGKKFSYDYLRSMIKETYKKGFDEDSTILNKSIDDYKNGVKSQREFIIDFTRTALTAATAGQSILLSGCIGAAVEAFGTAMNADASGEQSQTGVDLMSSMTSGFISSLFQGASKNILGKFKITQGGIGKLLSKLGIKNNKIINEQSLFKWIEIVGVKGVSAGAVKKASSFLFDNKDLVSKLLSGEMTKEEKEEFKNNFVSAVKSGALSGAVTGVLLALFETINIGYGEELKNAVHKGASKVIKGEIDTFYEKIIMNMINATGKTVARSGAQLANGDEVDWGYILETEFKEMAKNTFKHQ